MANVGLRVGVGVGVGLGDEVGLGVGLGVGRGVGAGLGRAVGVGIEDVAAEKLGEDTLRASVLAGVGDGSWGAAGDRLVAGDRGAATGSLGVGGVSAPEAAAVAAHCKTCKQVDPHIRQSQSFIQGIRSGWTEA